MDLPIIIAFVLAAGFFFVLLTRWQRSGEKANDGCGYDHSGCCGHDHDHSHDHGHHHHDHKHGEDCGCEHKH